MKHLMASKHRASFPLLPSSKERDVLLDQNSMLWRTSLEVNQVLVCMYESDTGKAYACMLERGGQA